jgi:hypothetical protein
VKTKKIGSLELGSIVRGGYGPLLVVDIWKDEFQMCHLTFFSADDVVTRFHPKSNFMKCVFVSDGDIHVLEEDP